MSNVDSLRAVIREQGLGDDLRRAEFQAIAEALAPGEEVRALAPAELRGRRGYLVATGQRMFFAHAGVAGTAISPIPGAFDSIRYVEDEEGGISLVIPTAVGEDVSLDGVPKPQAQAFARRLAASGAPGADGVPGC